MADWLTRRTAPAHADVDARSFTETMKFVRKDDGMPAR